MENVYLFQSKDGPCLYLMNLSVVVSWQYSYLVFVQSFPLVVLGSIYKSHNSKNY